MAENELKMPTSGQITTFAKLPRPLRLSFARYLYNSYGMPIQTAYGKIRINRIERWEWEGIENCVREFLGGNLPENLNGFFDKIPSKRELMRFMSQRSMCERTAFRRFGKMDFKPWEMKGIRNIWDEFASQVELVDDEIK